MTGTWLLHGIREATEVIPAGRDVHRLAQGRFDPVGDLLARPLPVVVWWCLEAQIQRFPLDLVEQEGRLCCLNQPNGNWEAGGGLNFRPPLLRPLTTSGTPVFGCFFEWRLEHWCGNAGGGSQVGRVSAGIPALVSLA